MPRFVEQYGQGMSFDGVMLTVLAVLVGLVVGFARHGKVKAIAAANLRARGLLIVGIGVPALAEQFTRDVAVPLVLVGMAALFVFALRNVRIGGMSVLAIGVVANVLPTLLNGGMPVRREALVEADIVTRDELDRVEVRGARRLEEPTHQLRFLGDVIPLPETEQVLSFGDLIVLAGLADVTANLTRTRRRRRAEGFDEVDELHDDGGLELPTVEEYLAVTVRSHVDADEPYDPRPVARWYPDDRALDASSATVEHAPARDAAGVGSLAAVRDDLVDEDEEDDEDAGLFDAATVAGRWGGELIWWTADDPPPPPPLPPADTPGEWVRDLSREPAWRTEPADESPSQPDAGEPAVPRPHPTLADEPIWSDRPIPTDPEPPADQGVDDQVLAIDALDGIPGDGTVALDDLTAGELTGDEVQVADGSDDELGETPEDVLDDRPLDNAQAATNGHHDDLSTLAHAAPDDLVKALVGDLTVRRRKGRRTGGRHIPDFEPIHLDDDPVLPG